MIQHAVLLLVLFIGSLCAFSQEKKAEAGDTEYYVNTKDTHYELTRYDDSDGMSQWHVTKVLQDDRGFMWFATWNGLNRFDGYNFVSFKTKPGDGIDVVSDRVRNILLDREVYKDMSQWKGNIFCRIDDSIFLFDTHTYTYHTLDTATQKMVRALMEQEEKKYAKKHAVVCNDDVIGGVSITYRDRQQNAWLKTDDGIYKISPRQRFWHYVEGLKEAAVRVAFRDKQQNIWLSTRDVPQVAVYDEHLTLKGYLGMDGRIHQEHVLSVSAYSMYHDSKGILWLGSKPDGLFRLTKISGSDAYKMEHVPGSENKAGLLSDYIYDIKEDRKGRLWIATLGEGLHVIENPHDDISRLRVYHHKNSLRGYPQEMVKVRKVMILDDGTLLATTTTGLLVIDDIYKHDLNHMTYHQHKREANRKESLTNSATMDMLFDCQGHLVVSTESGGLNILETKDLHAKTFDFRHLTTDNGLLSDVIQTICKIDNDRILLQQNNLLTVLDDKNELDQTYMPAFWGENFRFSDARPILLDGNRVLISLERGAMTLTLDAMRQNYGTPRIVLTELDIADRKPQYNIDASDTIRVAAGERSFVLKYAALDYRSNKTIWYVTRIDNEQWEWPTNTRELAVHDLAAGTHVLHIRSTNALGQWTDNEREVTIIVEPKFFETWYGKLLLFLMVAAVTAGIVYTVVYIRNINTQRRETLQSYLALMAEKNRSVAENAGNADDDASDDDSQEMQADEDMPHNDNAGETAAEAPEMSAAKRKAEIEILTPHLSPEDNAFMQKLTNFVAEHMGDSNVGVQDIADATATSKSSLNRKMHQLLGVTPADFLREARMKRACEMLMTTTKSMTTIAYACGFSDPKYFSKSFKASMGLTPKEYRETHNS